MTSGALIALFFVVLLVLMLAGIPIAYALGIASAGYMVMTHTSLVMVAQRMVNGANSFTMLAIPFFFMAGELMNISGVTDKIIKMAKALVGHFKGGLAQVNIVASVFFAGVGAGYMQLVGSGIDHELPRREILADGDLRFNFGGMFSGYLDLRPGVAYIWESKAWTLHTGMALGFDVARSFQLGLELNLLPLNIGKPSATPLDTLIGIRAGLSFGGGCRR